MALLADTVGAENAGQAMGYVGTAYSLATLLAPLLGGIVYEKAGYYQVFGMTFGMIAFGLALRLLLIEKKAAKKWLPQVSEVPLRDPPRVGPNSPANLLTEERASPEPRQLERAQPPQHSFGTKSPILILLKSRRMQTAFFGNMIVGMVFTAFDTTLPLFVSETWNWNSIGGGIIFLAPLAPSFLSPLYGKFYYLLLL